MTHAHAFDAQWKALVNPESYETSIQMNSDWTEGIIKAVPNGPMPENDLALELGEMFYQLRAALDAAVYQAFIFSGGFAVSTDENRAEFPIYTTEGHFERNPVNKRPFPKKLRDWLELIQPYNIEKAPTRVTVQALQLLHDCSRKDRHRRLHVVAAVPTNIVWEFFVSEPGKITSVQTIPANFFDDKMEFLVFRLEGATPDSNIQIKLNTDVLIEVAVDEIPSVSSEDIGNKINWIFHTVTAAINHFEGAFGSQI